MEYFCEECERLRAENKRLTTLLKQHGIPCDTVPQLTSTSQPLPEHQDSPLHRQLSLSEKVTLFGSLFRGRSDVFPIRWESAKGKTGYSPACGNEWVPDKCGKPKAKCSDCDNRRFVPLTDRVIYDHLSGNHTIGIYPLLADDTCHFLAVDFDELEWKADSHAFVQSCRKLMVPVSLEISRSGQGAHTWIFFDSAVPARDARRLGTAIISHTCARTHQLSLSSYDRFFPNQDILPKGGFGNLIALPLQKKARMVGRSVFVDDEFIPWEDQWEYLASIKPMCAKDIESCILKVTGGKNPLDVAFVEDHDDEKPWQRPSNQSDTVTGIMPDSLSLVLANQIYMSKNELPQSLANRLIRLAAFQNPEFYKAQAMRFPVWNKPRVIGCAENLGKYIGIPRGCIDSILNLLESNNIRAIIQDERTEGIELTVRFTGVLRADQEEAVTAMIKHEVGVLSAPTAFGKTVTAAAMIARRKTSTLILVHRTALLRQWQERLASFLDLPPESIGLIGGGTKKPSGRIDIAVMQSLSRYTDLLSLLNHYGQIIIDECHHISAFSFEAILKQAKAKFILGLTATPIRRDGHHPIFFMQCGPVRHNASRPVSAPTHLEVWSQKRNAPKIPPESGIQDVFRILAKDGDRNIRIVHDIQSAYNEGRKILVLTERTEHLKLLQEALGNSVEHCFILHGRLSKKQRTSILERLSQLEETSPMILFSTGRLIGEGFDHPPLVTLVLALPISWRGTLQQYAGRLHREHMDKQNVRIYDYIEHDHIQLSRMWEKRTKGYQAMGYNIIPVK